MSPLADLGSVPVAFIFPSAFIAPLKGETANKLRGLPPHPLPSGDSGGGGRCLLRQSPSLSPRCLPFPRRKSPKRRALRTAALSASACARHPWAPHVGETSWGQCATANRRRGGRVHNICVCLCAAPKVGLRWWSQPAAGSVGRRCSWGLPCPHPTCCGAAGSPPTHPWGLLSLICAPLSN